MSIRSIRVSHIVLSTKDVAGLLLENLNSGHVYAAGLDVINGEWDKNLYDHPLIEYQNLFDILP